MLCSPLSFSEGCPQNNLLSVIFLMGGRKSHEDVTQRGLGGRSACTLVEQG